MADAVNIGWKLGWVLNGKAGAGLLDSYTPERRGATMDVFANASKSARFMTPPTHGWETMRNAALSLALDHDFAGELANPRQMRPYIYSDSPSVLEDDAQFDTGPEVGNVMADVKLNQGFLSDAMGAVFTLLCFHQTLADTVAAQISKDALGLCVQPVNGRVADIYGGTKTTAYLIRPDGHIAARWRDVSVSKVQKALNVALHT